MFLYFKVGDIVHVEANSSFPCDMVMLSSHDPEGSCYITTANLDGETNLKVSKKNKLLLFFSAQTHKNQKRDYCLIEWIITKLFEESWDW